ncbi:putative mfs monosaccharide [Phaeomoniella chlamydospora]|uniref:Putative mfs monosaccharide n=1 Tax=Phaeomoniella chlamydospora TaxID=158046 RepID=A0A0G2GT38_PHACM|nr:putative mfs monosaccharide [Phaeomoniella chlamydospora]
MLVDLQLIERIFFAYQDSVSPASKMGLMLKKPDEVAGSAVPAILVGLFVAFGGVLFGYDTGTISGILAMKYWRKLFSTGYINPTDNYPDITSSQSSEIVSILSAGTFFGALLSAPLADFIGRRLAMIFNTVVFTFGVILQTVATGIPLFVAGRFFAGLGVGLLSATVPLYQSETAPKWIRGTIVGCYQLAITIGLLIAAVVNNSTKERMDTGSYRIPIAVQFAWAIILVIGMVILPETPRFLIKKGRHADAVKALSRLRRISTDHPALIKELTEIQASHELLTGCALQALQQLTGVNFIFYYGTQFFQNSGISNAFVISMITNAVNVASTFPGLYMVEKWGRRPLLLFGAIGMAVCQLIVASVGTALPESQVANQGEIFPLKARAKCLSMTTASNWLLNFAIAEATPYMVNSGPGNANLQAKVFFVWGGFCVICAGFIVFCVYETKGLSLEEVDELYSKVDKAWKSKGFVPTVRFAEVQDLQVNARQASLADLETQAARKKSVAHREDLGSKEAYHLP